MNHLATFLVVSLFLRVSASSSQNTKPGSTLSVTSDKFLQNIALAVGLSQAFKADEVGMKAEHFSPIYNSSTVPFVFPTSESYDMALSEKLSKRTGITPQRIFSILVQIIYTLLQFHVKRLFRLDPSEPFVPCSEEYGHVKWEDNPHHWFFVLLSAIMPGTTVDLYHYGLPIVLTHISIKPFQFLAKDDHLFEYRTYNNGTPAETAMHCNVTMPTVSIHVLPTSFLGKTLAPGQPVVRTIRLAKSYPPCKEILNHLLQGITFDFSLSHSELEILVKSTEDIPSVQESRRILTKLFNAPIGTQIMVPENIKSALQGNIIPKISCYHPAKLSFGSSKLYEHMLTLIVTGGVLKIFQRSPDIKAGQFTTYLEKWMQMYLPDSSIKAFESRDGMIKRGACSYSPEFSSMQIYSADVDGVSIAILLELGKPVVLNHIQMSTLGHMCFPFWLRFLHSEIQIPLSSKSLMSLL